MRKWDSEAWLARRSCGFWPLNKGGDSHIALQRLFAPGVVLPPPAQHLQTFAGLIQGATRSRSKTLRGALDSTLHGALDSEGPNGRFGSSGAGILQSSVFDPGRMELWKPLGGRAIFFGPLSIVARSSRPPESEGRAFVGRRCRHPPYCS